MKLKKTILAKKIEDGLIGVKDLHDGSVGSNHWYYVKNSKPHTVYNWFDDQMNPVCVVIPLYEDGVLWDYWWNFLCGKERDNSLEKLTNPSEVAIQRVEEAYKEWLEEEEFLKREEQNE